MDELKFLNNNSYMSDTINLRNKLKIIIKELKQANEEWKQDTIAHKVAYENPELLPNDIEILSLADKDGRTVAHVLAHHHPALVPNDIKILSLADKDGRTVAHELAIYNPSYFLTFPPTSEVLTLTNQNGRTVKAILG